MSKQNQKRRQRIAKVSTPPSQPPISNGKGKPLSRAVQLMLSEIDHRKARIRDLLRERRDAGYRSRSRRQLDSARGASIRMESASIRDLRRRIAASVHA